jgi:hypothetical protein
LNSLSAGAWTHEGVPILNRKLRDRFDRSVVYLPDEAKYVVRLGHFRGEIDVEEAGFFVRAVDLLAGEVHLSDGSKDALDLGSLETSAIDGALICRVKRPLAPDGLPARFLHSAQADLLCAVEEGDDGLVVEMAGRPVPMSDL